MAIQFPNFLAAQLLKPDYSGIGDAVTNYYAGRQMPSDDLIKRVAAQFAEPNAQQSLVNARLTGDQLSLANQKARIDLQQSLALQKAISDAIAKGKMAAAIAANGGNAISSVTSSISVPNRMPLVTASNASPPIPASLDQTDYGNASPSPEDVQGLDRTKMDRRFVKYDRMASGLPLSAYRPGASPTPTNVSDIAPALSQAFAGTNAKAQPIATGSLLAPAGAPVTINGVAPPQTPALLAQQNSTNPSEQVVNPGDPALYGIDELYDSNIAARNYLEDKKFKKTIQTKFDSKTGTTRIITTYPSGKVVMTTTGNTANGQNGLPLTNAMVTQHQRVISGVDNTLPIINELIEQGQKANDTSKGSKTYEFEPFPRDSWRGLGLIYPSKATAYEAKVNAALDTLMAAYGMPKTEGGLESVRSQLLIGHGESDKAYVNRLIKLREDLNRRKAYSMNEVKRAAKMGIDTSSNSASNADENDTSDLQNYDSGEA